MRFATYASVTAAAVLIAAKLVAWSLTGSVAVLSTLVDSLLDLLASLVTLFAVRQGLNPADREHRFGHGEAEPLAAVAQSAFIAGRSEEHTSELPSLLRITYAVFGVQNK